MSQVLKQINDLSGHIFLGDRLVASTATDGIEVIDPATEVLLGTIPETTPSG